MKSMQPIVVLFTWLLATMVSGTVFAAPTLSSPLSPWNGEYMQAEQGTVYVRFYLDSFRRTRTSKDITNNVFMNFKNLKTGQLFVLTQEPFESATDAVLIWKIPSGNYSVEKLSINENTGITRNWVPTGKHPVFKIRTMFVSNLGQIHLSPDQTTGLKVTFKSSPNLFNGDSGNQTFMGVMDGYKASLQKKLGGAKLLKQSKDNFGSSSEARAAFTMVRQISMIHQVDSSGTQQSRKLMSATISAQDAELRRCYMDQLDLALGLRGSVNFRFQIAPKSGSFQALSYSGGSLSNQKTIDCLTMALKKLQFPIARPLSGRLAFQFNYDDNPGRAKFP
ncbi:MAG: hypothetical protein H7249_18085 [Chitinophagaceae bacterium]|nr:hypothetical protein [Oligoflexus sp.]